MLKTFLKWIFVIVAVPGMALGSLYYLDQAGFFNLQNIDVSLSKEIGQQEYLKPLMDELQLQLSSKKGSSLWKINIEEIARNFEGQKWIESTSVSRQWPATLQVRIAPKEIKLLYYGKNSLFFPVAEDGQLMSGVGINKAPDVALLRGERFEKNVELRRRAIDMVNQIPTGGKFSQKTVSEVFYDKRDGFWVTMVDNGMKVKMGEDKFSLKAHRVAQVIEYLENRKFEPRVIDANLSKKVLVRLRKEP